MWKVWDFACHFPVAYFCVCLNYPIDYLFYPEAFDLSQLFVTPFALDFRTTRFPPLICLHLILLHLYLFSPGRMSVLHRSSAIFLPHSLILFATTYPLFSYVICNFLNNPVKSVILIIGVGKRLLCLGECKLVVALSSACIGMDL